MAVIDNHSEDRFGSGNVVSRTVRYFRITPDTGRIAASYRLTRRALAV
jgi:hypothetical protein